MGIIERRNREKAQRRQEIVDQARKLFLDQGLEKPTMQEIADAAEISKGAIYLHFRDKDSLLREILFQSIEKLQTSIQARGIGAGNATDKLKALAFGYLDFESSCPDDFTFISLFDLLGTVLWTSSRDSATADPLTRRLGELRGYFENALAEGVAEGLLRHDMDVAKTALVFSQIVNSFMQKLAKTGSAVRTNTGYDSGELISCVFLNLIRAIVAPERMAELEQVFETALDSGFSGRGGDGLLRPSAT